MNNHMFWCIFIILFLYQYHNNSLMQTTLILKIKTIISVSIKVSLSIKDSELVLDKPVDPEIYL